jgi:nucleotide-binding universal stress UspA family protein
MHHSDHAAGGLDFSRKKEKINETLACHRWIQIFRGGHSGCHHAISSARDVVDLPLPIPTSDAAGFRELSLKHGQELVQQAEKVLNKAGYKTQTAVEEGDPNSKIIDQAKKWKADLIVMGSHGRKGLNRFLMGSVAQTVSRHAPCSVEIVRVPGNR